MRGSIREKRRGVWELRVYLGRDPYTGKIIQRSETFHGTEKDAEAKLNDLISKANRGRLGRRGDTVGSALDHWLEHRRALRRSPTTIEDYESKVKKIKGSPLGMVPLSKLTSQHLNGFYRERLSAGNSPTTVRHYHRILSGALRFVENEEWIDWGGKTPADRSTPPEPDEAEAYNPTVEEVLKLIHAAESSRQPAMADFLRVAALTGMRRGEMCALRWRDIDWDNATINVRRSIYQVVGEIGERSTKNRCSERVELGSAGLYLLLCLRDQAIAEAQAAGLDLLDDGYVFSSSEDGSTPWTPNGVTQYVTRLRNRLGIPDFHLHSLRHWSGSELEKVGIDIRNIAGRLGHSDGGALLLNRYAHRSNEQDRKAAEILAGLLGLPSDETMNPPEGLEG